MDPGIQYAITEDGVRIAYSVYGKGTPLVIVPTLLLSHVEWEWRLFRPFYTGLGQSFRVIWYDARGSGASERNVTDLSLAAMVRDLSAVVERNELQMFALAGFVHGVPVAATFAAATPGRVSHLVLIDGYAKHSETWDSPAVRADQALLEEDWTIYTDTLARVLLGYDDPSFASQMGEYARHSTSKETLIAGLSAARDIDIYPLLSQIVTPTLVLHNRDSRWVPITSAQSLAASIPDSRLLVVDDKTYERIPVSIDEFVHGAAPATYPLPGEPRPFRSVLFTDLVGHAEMMSRLGDERGRAVLREHERITREVLKANGGTEVKTMGDGFMASFGSVTKAVECAIALQRAFDDREGEPLTVRVGLNAGEPIEEDGDLFGATVILASRIAAKAEGAEILVADTVRGLCSGKGFLFADRGEFVAKGFEEPVRVYEVRWRDD